MENLMTIQDAIKTRRSRRKYILEPLDISTIYKLEALIGEYNNEGLDIRLVVNNGDVFGGFRTSYGIFSSVRNYFCLIGDENDPVYIEKLGYYGELLILHATALGLGTCWVSGTIDRSSCPFELAKGQTVICVIAIGRVHQDLSLEERLIRNFIHSNGNSVEQVNHSGSPLPDWFLVGMEAVRLAPFAANRPPVIFAYDDGIVTASVKDIPGQGFSLDLGIPKLHLGIAKLHFELGAGGGTWSFGNGSAFMRQKQ